MVELIGIEPMT